MPIVIKIAIKRNICLKSTTSFPIKTWTSLKSKLLWMFWKSPIWWSKMFSGLYTKKWESVACLLLWSPGFLARRVFDKVIFYLNPLYFQQVCVQKLFAGASQVVLLLGRFDLQPEESSLLRNLLKLFELLIWCWLHAVNSLKTVTSIIASWKWLSPALILCFLKADFW